MSVVYHKGVDDTVEINIHNPCGAAFREETVDFKKLSRKYQFFLIEKIIMHNAPEHHGAYAVANVDYFEGAISRKSTTGNPDDYAVKETIAFLSTHATLSNTNGSGFLSTNYVDLDFTTLKGKGLLCTQRYLYHHAESDNADAIISAKIIGRFVPAGDYEIVDANLKDSYGNE